MTHRAGLLVGAVCLAATTATAGPWTQPGGEGQVIVKYEDMRADEGFDPDGRRRPLPGQQRDEALRSFSEYGLTDRLTLQVKADIQSGEDAFIAYEGRGPLEIGLTWQVWRDDRTAISVHAAYASNGEGRNALYAGPGLGDEDIELRASIGRSFDGALGMRGRWAPERSFAETQVAVRARDGLPDEVRMDSSVGGHFGRDWMVLAQAFGGFADGGSGARWLSVETTLVRHLGPWSLQAGWRETVAGRETPISGGPVVALWRRF